MADFCRGATGSNKIKRKRKENFLPCPEELLLNN